jgi:type IV fimbrial biogenesis protein FimT
MVTHMRRRARGFTLIELMTVIAVLTLLATAAAPGMQSLIASQRARAAANDLISDLLMARSEAVKRNKDVSLSPASGWADGWVVKTVATAELLGQRNRVGSGVTITRSPASLTYDGAGRLSGVTSTVRFELFDGNSTYRCITVQPSGQPSTKTKACP